MQLLATNSYTFVSFQTQKTPRNS